MEVIVGVASLPLKFLAYMIEFRDEDQLNVIDYSAQHCGFLQVQLIPCDNKGSEEVDLVVERPEDLVHVDGSVKPDCFILVIHSEQVSRLTATQCY